ncbi:MAG: ferrochelatase, partial [Gemmatimonadales bacterium]
MRYLREFRGDPRVLDVHPLLRWYLLNLVFLPFRPRRSAAQYASIWTPEGSQLMVHSLAPQNAWCCTRSMQAPHEVLTLVRTRGR